MDRKAALVIAFAVLRICLGRNQPRLRVLREGSVNRIRLECLDSIAASPLSEGTFVFRNPKTGSIEKNVTIPEDGMYVFTVHPSNESMISCRRQLDSIESFRVGVAAIPQYTAATAIRQYVYSDSVEVEIVCPFLLGRLESLYMFSWEGVGSNGRQGPIKNGTLGVYWLAEERNMILHVNVSATPLRRFKCIGIIVPLCGSATGCERTESESPRIILTPVDPVNLTLSPIGVTASESSDASFTCRATGQGSLSIEWRVNGDREKCVSSSRCSITNPPSDGNYTVSTLNLNNVSFSDTNMTVVCIVNQTLNPSIEDNNIEVRLPESKITESQEAFLTIIQAPTSGSAPQSQKVNNVTLILVIIFTLIVLIICIQASCIFCIFHFHYENKESQLGRPRRTICRNPDAVVTCRAPISGQLDIEITRADTPPIIYTGPDNIILDVQNENNLNSDHQQIYNKSQSPEVTSVSSYSGMSGVSQDHGPHNMPQFNDEPSAHLGWPPSTDYSDSYEAASNTDRHDILSYRSLQHFDTNEAKTHCLVELNDEQSTTDETSTVYSSAVDVPCPIMMNTPEISTEER